jgi:hypothetical protein
MSNSNAPSASWLRFSLRGMMAATAFLLLAMMSLIYATGWVPNLWFTILLGSLAVAACCWRVGLGRTFAEGYLLFGGGYTLLLVMGSWPNSNAFLAHPAGIQTMLVTHSINDWAYSDLLPLVRDPPPPPAPNSGGFFGGGPLGQFGGMSEGGLGGDAPNGGGGGFGGADPSAGFNSGLSLTIGGGQSVLSEYPDHTSFQRVAHCLWGLVIGLAGGRFMQALRHRRDAT